MYARYASTNGRYASFKLSMRFSSRSMYSGWFFRHSLISPRRARRTMFFHSRHNALFIPSFKNGMSRRIAFDSAYVSGKPAQ